VSLLSPVAINLALVAFTLLLVGFGIHLNRLMQVMHSTTSPRSTAARLATTPETVSRALRDLEDTGAIRFDRHRIIILAPDLLQEISLQ
jgi:DNA-binding transcriptional regulator YhcF (GntR family)